MTKHKAKKRPVLHRNRFDCIDCGLGVWVDEDGLCRGCGRQTVIIENGVPDYSAVLAGIEADEASAARLADRVARSAPAAPKAPERGALAVDRSEETKGHAATCEWTVRGGLCDCFRPVREPPATGCACDDCDGTGWLTFSDGTRAKCMACSGRGVTGGAA